MTVDDNAAPGAADEPAALPEEPVDAQVVDQADQLIAEVDHETGTDIEPTEILDAKYGPDSMPKGGSDMILRREATDDESAREITLYVYPVVEWPTSAMTDLRGLFYDGWASKCLTYPSQEKWLDFEPTIGEINDAFTDRSRRLALDAGKSRPSTGSSRSTRRR